MAMALKNPSSPCQASSRCLWTCYPKKWARPLNWACPRCCYLDCRPRRTLWALLRNYRAENSFVLLTTHSMEEAEALCDRVGIIKGGELVALDTVENLRAEFNFEFKLTYHRGNGISDDQILYGSDDQGLIERAREMGVNQYSVSRTTLGDIYLTITGDLAEVDESDD